MKPHIPILATLLVAALLPTPPLDAADAGQPAPAFALPTAKGETIALDKLRGKVVYVDFWASWCVPCRESMPLLDTLYKRHRDAGFAVVGINKDVAAADAERFLVQNPANFTVVYDEAGGTPAAYGVKGMPSSYLIDARGNVTFVERGFLDESKAELESRVAALVAAAKN